MSDQPTTSPPFWSDRDGQKLTCTEKLRMLRENEAELRQVLQDAYEDAVLMGVDPAIMRARFMALFNELEEPFLQDQPGQSAPGETR